jgi:hypothetical protein
LTPGSDITSDTNPFIGTPTPVQIINMIFDPAYSWASDLYSKDFLAVSNIQVTSKSGTATISGQGFLYGTTNVTFDVQSAPTLAELVTTTNVTPTPNN